MYGLVEFILARGGPVHSFPFKDWSDYCTSAYGTTHNPGDVAVDDEDVILGVGTGVLSQFQAIKKYTSGTTVRNRNIYLIKQGTFLLSVDGVLKTETTDYSVDYSTGLITMVVAPTLGQVVSAGFEFYVKCQFGAEIDEAVKVSIDDYNTTSLPDIPLREVREGVVTEDEFMYGGAKDHGELTGGTAVLSKAYGLLHVVSPQGPAATVMQLPSLTGIQDGGPHFIVSHGGGAGNLMIKNNDLSTTVATIMTSGAGVSIYKFGVNWYAI